MSDPNPNRPGLTQSPTRPSLVKGPGYVGGMMSYRPMASASQPSPSLSSSIYSASPPLSPFQMRTNVDSPATSISPSPTSPCFGPSSLSSSMHGAAGRSRHRSNSSPGSFPLRRSCALASSPLAGSQMSLDCVVESDSDPSDGSDAEEEDDGLHLPSTIRPARRAMTTGAAQPSSSPTKPLNINVPPASIFAPSSSSPTGAYYANYPPTSPPLGSSGPMWSPSSPTSGGGLGAYYFNNRHSSGTGSFPLRSHSRPSPLANAVALAPQTDFAAAGANKLSSPRRRQSAPHEGQAEEEGESLGLGLGLSASPMDTDWMSRTAPSL